MSELIQALSDQELAEIKRTASSALAIDSENKDLKSRMVALERNLQTVQQENENLKDRTARDWFNSACSARTAVARDLPLDLRWVTQQISPRGI